MNLSNPEANDVSTGDRLIEGWAFRPAVSRNKARILSAATLVERAKHYGPMSKEAPLPRAAVRDALHGELLRSPSGLIVAFSHDHYLTIAGGVQNCLRDEQILLCAEGWAYLHLCPNRPLPMLAEPVPADSFEVLISLSGATIGVALLSDLEVILDEVRATGRVTRSIVHHLLGFAPERVEKLVRATGDVNPIVWVHDLFTLCPSIHMLRNDATFCFAPKCDSAVCGICVYGPDRSSHVRRMSDFFASLRPQVVAPSATLLEFWRCHGGYACRQSRVVAPCEVCFDRVVPAYDAARPLRVAFLGSSAYHKGWDAYESLVRWHVRDPRYQFFHIGSEGPDVPRLQRIPVTVTPGSRLAMVEAVTEAGIDVVINWSLCYESFSFTAAEAVAAGAFVVARRDAGHVWPLVNAVNARRGCRIATDVELYALFASGEILGLAANADRRAGTLKFGRYSGELLQAETQDA